MKVILLEDIRTLGKKGEIVEVSDGYARNVLLKKNQCLEATSKNLNDLKLKKANQEKVAAESLVNAQELAKKLETASITLKVKCGEAGRLFGSISSREIAEAAREQLGYEIDKKKIMLSSPIKTVGTVSVPIRLHTKVTASLKVNVEAL